MIKEWQHIDLSQATIFDLTDNIELIRQAEDCQEEEDDPNPMTYISECSRRYIVNSMLSYAQIIKDESLYKAIEEANPEVLTVYDE